MARMTERRDQCCLCGKTKDQVRKLIVGLHGAVCSDCIDLCNDILQGEAEKQDKEKPSRGPVAAMGVHGTSKYSLPSQYSSMRLR